MKVSITIGVREKMGLNPSDRVVISLTRDGEARIRPATNLKEGVELSESYYYRVPNSIVAAFNPEVNEKFKVYSYDGREAIFGLYNETTLVKEKGTMTEELIRFVESGATRFFKKDRILTSKKEKESSEKSDETNLSFQEVAATSVVELDRPDNEYYSVSGISTIVKGNSPLTEQSHNNPEEEIAGELVQLVQQEEVKIDRSCNSLFSKESVMIYLAKLTADIRKSKYKEFNLSLDISTITEERSSKLIRDSLTNPKVNTKEQVPAENLVETIIVRAVKSNTLFEYQVSLRDESGKKSMVKLFIHGDILAAGEAIRVEKPNHSVIYVMPIQPHFNGGGSSFE